MLGYPKVDNCPPFNAKLFRQYLEFNDIIKKSITPYYPKAYGIAERFMRVIKKTICASFYENRNWRKELNKMLLDYRAAPHSVIGRSQSYLLFVRNINNRLPLITEEKHVSDE